MPLRIVIDPTLRTPTDASILNDDAPTIIAYEDSLDASKFNCETIALPSKDGVLELEQLLQHVVDAHNATHVIVEGGANTIVQFIKQKLVNELWIFNAPTTTTLDTYINMNELVETLDCTLQSEEKSGVDSQLRYLINS